MDVSKDEFGLVELLRFAAAPTFAVMALVSTVSGGPRDAFCGTGSPLTGMGAMYTLMSVFHAGPWLKLVAGWHEASRLH
jgi:hypothetical protein